MIHCFHRSFAVGKKAAIILSGSGFLDGTEIQEATSALIAFSCIGVPYQCYALGKQQHQTINHLNAQIQQTSRHTMEEASRIAKGKILDLSKLKTENYDFLLMPGGKGVLSNLSNYPLKNSDFTVEKELHNAILECVKLKKIMLLCSHSSLLVAKILQSKCIKANLSVGDEKQYDSKQYADIIRSLGHAHTGTILSGFLADPTNNILCAPCYLNTYSTPSTVFKEINSMIAQAYYMATKEFPKPVIADKQYHYFKKADEKKEKQKPGEKATKKAQTDTKKEKIPKEKKKEKKEQKTKAPATDSVAKENSTKPSPNDENKAKVISVKQNEAKAMQSKEKKEKVKKSDKKTTKPKSK